MHSTLWELPILHMLNGLMVYKKSVSFTSQSSFFLVLSYNSSSSISICSLGQGPPGAWHVIYNNNGNGMLSSDSHGTPAYSEGRRSYITREKAKEIGRFQGKMIFLSWP